MGNVAGVYFAGLDVPQFLDADSVTLRVQIIEFLFFDELLGERAARAFGEHCHFCAQFVTGREIVLGLAVLVDAFVFGDDAGDAIAFVNQFAAAELCEKVYAGGFHQAAEPLGDFVQRNDVIAGVHKRRRSNRRAERGTFGKEQRGRISHRSIERSSFCEVRYQFSKRLRIHDRAGKLVRANFAAFFQHVNILRRQFGLGAGRGVRFDEIGKVQRTGESRRPRTDDQHIRFELLALHAHGHAVSAKHRNRCLTKLLKLLESDFKLIQNLEEERKSNLALSR